MIFYVARSVRVALITAPISIFSSTLYASGFQVWEQSASSLGVAHADMAAGAYDASTAYYNPAGMTRFEDPELIIGTEAADIVDKVNYSATVISPLIPPALGGQLKLGDTTAHPTDGAFFPFFHGVYPLENLPFDDLNLPNMAFGLSIVTPYFLETNYNGYAASTYARKTKIETILINPSLAIEIFNGFSLGLGLDVQQTQTQLNSSIDVNTLPVVNLDSEGESWDTSWNVGLMYELSDFARVGLTYRPQVDTHLTGHTDLDILEGTLAPFSQSVSSSVNLNLPAVTSGGLYVDVTDVWALMFNVAYTRWSTVNDVTVHNEETLSLGPIPVTEATIPLDWEDTFFFSAGTSYEPADRWILRAGVGFDQTPTPDDTREMRIPDTNRVSFALGGGYEITEDLAIDLSYAYIYGPSENLQNPVLAVELPFPININDFVEYTGTTKGYAHVFGAQINYIF